MEQLVRFGNPSLYDDGAMAGVIYGPLALLNTDPHRNTLTLTCATGRSSSARKRPVDNSSSSHYSGDNAGVEAEVKNSTSSVTSGYATRSHAAVNDQQLHTMLDEIETHQRRRRAEARASGRDSVIYTDHRPYPRVGIRVVGVRKGAPRNAQKLTLKQGKEMTLSYGTAHTRRVTRQQQQQP